MTRRGFTLVELMVSLGIIVIIISLSLAGINNARIRSRDAKRIADLQTIQQALEQHALGDASHAYPPSEADKNTNPTYCPQDLDSDGKNGGIYNNPCFSTYLSVVPTDPRGASAPDGGRYSYARPGCFTPAAVEGGIVLSSGTTGCTAGSSTSYGLHTVLESGNNGSATKDATASYPKSYDLIP